MNWWNKISNIGIDQTMSKSNTRAIQLTNSIIFISSLIAIIYVPLLIWLEAKWMTIQLVIMILIILSFYLYSPQLKKTIALPIIAIVAIYHMATVSIAIQNSQLELYLILVSLIQFTVIKSKKVSFTIFIIGVLAYFTSLFLQETLETTVTMNKVQKIVMISCNSIGIFLGGLYLIFLVLSSNNKYRIDLLKERQRVVDKNKKIERQVEIIAKTNKEITDSINYSKRIQNAILPSASKVKKLLPESFILYKPKDIVAGDFYWVEETENNINFAVADCTGHGVPGAMMSVICTNALNRSLNEFKLIKPSEVLHKTRAIVLQDLEASEDNIKDGMDIALCSLSGNQLNYSGANIKLYIVRNNEILEYKPNKQPIGLYIGQETSYTNYTIELEKEDCIYLITDGYVDQFGGEKLKKFKTPALKKLLLDINKYPIAQQKQKMESAFDNWKGNLEQLDDVCVMGIKFNK